MNQPIINLDNLSIGYYNGRKRPKIIAHSLFATISAFRLTCLIGSNGVGKSTLLRTLAGLQSPLSGKIHIGNRCILSYSQRDLSKIISVVLTEKVNVQNMSVYELVSFGRSPYTGFFGKLSLKDKIIVEEAIHLVHIESLAHRAMQTLSDGERQKTMIAKALAQQTPIIFLDEPTVFLDYRSKTDIIQLLYKISKKRTIFLSTHDIELALQIVDTMWLMDREKGLITGSPREICSKMKM